VERPEVRYATTTDGLTIAYSVFGRGPVDLVMVPGMASHLEYMWEAPSFARMYERLGAVARVILFDKRGTGLSDREVGDGSLEARMEDLRAVMDAVRAPLASLHGWSEGGPMAMLFAATSPERVARLSLMGSFPHGGGEDTPLWRSVAALWGTGLTMRNFFATPPPPEVLRRFEQTTATPRAMTRIASMNARIDVRPILDQIRVPTLVIHDRRDPVVPVEAGRYLAHRIPGAQYVELDQGLHVAWEEHEWDLVTDELVAFHTGARPDRPAPTGDRVLATVLFTDIVDSTARAAALGDQSWRVLLDRHDELARAAIRRFRGQWVKSTGDGVLATFDGPGRAVECAKAIRDGAPSLGLEVRAGLHTGEVERRGGDVSGLAVHLAARVLGCAAAGEVLVSPTIPGLVTGSPLAFRPRGRHALKGLPEPVELFAAE